MMEAIDLVIDERSHLAGRAVLAQRRAIELEIAGTVGATAQQRLLDDLGSHSANAHRAAIRRTIRHIESEPLTSALIAPVIGLIAPGQPLDAAA